jgi:5-methylcytosine-specific restriction endonuclease McrA
VLLRSVLQRRDRPVAADVGKNSSARCDRHGLPDAPVVSRTRPRRSLGHNFHPTNTRSAKLHPSRHLATANGKRLCGVAPIPFSSGRTDRHRLHRDGDPQANSALWRIVLVRMRCHQPTRDYVARRTAEGKTTREIMRCLKRYVARETFPFAASYRRHHDARGDARRGRW